MADFPVKMANFDIKWQIFPKKCAKMTEISKLYQNTVFCLKKNLIGKFNNFHWFNFSMISIPYVYTSQFPR